MPWTNYCLSLFCFKSSAEDIFIDFQRERKRGYRERKTERERNIQVREKHQSVASHTCPDQGIEYAPHTCPDQESHRQPLTLGDNAPRTEPPARAPFFLNACFYVSWAERHRTASQLSVWSWRGSCSSLEAGSVCPARLWSAHGLSTLGTTFPSAVSVSDLWTFAPLEA